MVRFGEEAVDGGLQIDDGAEDAAFQAAAGQLGEVAFDGVEPGRGCRGEVEDKPGMALEPGADLVGCMIVENHVNQLSRRHLCPDDIEKADEFLMPVALHAATDDLAFKYVEGGEEGGGTVALLVVRHGLAAALLDRQSRLGTV